MLSLGEHINVIVRGTVLRGTVGTLCIAAQLAHGFHTGCPTVDDLYEVIVTVGDDRDAHLHAITHLCFDRRYKFAGDGETGG